MVSTCVRSYPRQIWSRFVTPDNRPNVNPDGIDLLEKLLRYNHHDRLTAGEALAHSFFSTYTPVHSHSPIPHCPRCPAPTPHLLSFLSFSPFLCSVCCATVFAAVPLTVIFFACIRRPFAPYNRCRTPRDAVSPRRVRERLRILFDVTTDADAVFLKAAMTSHSHPNQSSDRTIPNNSLPPRFAVHTYMSTRPRRLRPARLRRAAGAVLQRKAVVVAAGDPFSQS